MVMIMNLGRDQHEPEMLIPHLGANVNQPHGPWLSISRLGVLFVPDLHFHSSHIIWEWNLKE